MLARRAGAVLLAIMLGAGVAACGDDSGSDDDAVDQVDRDDSSDDSSDDGSSDDGDDGSSDDGQDDDGDGSAIEGAFTGERCQELAGFFGTMSAAVTGAIDEEFEEAQAAFDEAVEDVPEEVQDAFRGYVDAYTEYLQALQDAGFDVNDPDPASFADPDVLAAAQALSSSEFVEDAQEISDFFANGCEA